MKKLSIIITLILVFSLTFSSFAMFPDVPSDHWAYEDIQELTAQDIFEGYPDGEFKGDNNLTRYEYAIVVNRILDNLNQKLNEDIGDIEGELKNVVEDVESYAEGLTPGEAKEAKKIADSVAGALIKEAAGQEDMEKISTEISEMQENLEAQISGFEEDLKDQEESYNELVDKYENLDNELGNNLEELEGEIERFESALNTTIENNDEMKEELNDEIADNLEKITELQDEVSEYVEELNDLSYRVDVHKKLNSRRYEEVNEKIDDRYDELEEAIQSDIEELVGIEEFEESEEALEGNIEEQKSLFSQLNESLKTKIDDTISLQEELRSDVDQLEEKVSDVENTVSFKGPQYGLNYGKTVIDGDMDAYLDPYNDADEDEVYKETEEYNQDLGFGLEVITQDFKADLTFNHAIEDFFDGGDDSSWSYSDIKAKIEADDFTADIDKGLEPDMRDYLYAEDEEADGVLAEVKGNKYVLGGDDDESVIFAGETVLPFLNNDYNIAFGVENPVVSLDDTIDRNIVMGIDTEYEDIFGFNITPELAFSDSALSERYFDLGVKREFGQIETEFNYIEDTGLVGIKDDLDVTDGYDINADMDFLDLSATFESYAVNNGDKLPALRISAAEKLFNINNEVKYDNFTGESSSMFRYFADTAYSVGNLDLTAELDFVRMDDDFVDLEENYLDDDFDDEYKYADDAFVKTLIAEYDINNLETEAKYTIHDLGDKFYQDYWAKYTMLGGNLAASADISINDSIDQTYALDYDPGDELSANATLTTDDALNGTYAHIYSASYDFNYFETEIEQYMNHGDYADNNGVATVFMSKFTGYTFGLPVVDVDVSPYADFGYKLSDGSYTNYALGLDASKELIEGLTATGNIEKADKSFRVDEVGQKFTKKAALDYEVSSNIGAELEYEEFSFDGDSGYYDVRKGVGSISVEF